MLRYALHDNQNKKGPFRAEGAFSCGVMGL